MISIASRIQVVRQSFAIDSGLPPVLRRQCKVGSPRIRKSIPILLSQAFSLMLSHRQRPLSPNVFQKAKTTAMHEPFGHTFVSVQPKRQILNAFGGNQWLCHCLPYDCHMYCMYWIAVCLSVHCLLH